MENNNGDDKNNYITFAEIMARTKLSCSSVSRRIKKLKITKYFTGYKGSKMILMSDFLTIFLKPIKKKSIRETVNPIKKNELTVPEFFQKYKLTPSRVYAFTRKVSNELSNYGMRRDVNTDKIIITNEVKLLLGIKSVNIIKKWKKKFFRLAEKIKKYNASFEKDVQSQYGDNHINFILRNQIYLCVSEGLPSNIINYEGKEYEEWG